ncbi:MAG TPA: sulfite exporter TauE/SafE family protein [Chitinophagaceae bacterium]
MFTIISTGLVLGLASSLHCVGMCGPLSLGLPMHETSQFRRMVALALYHLGRIITYSLLGLLFGLMGRKFYLAGMQQGLSIALGVVMLVVTLQYFVFRYAYQPVFIKKMYSRLQQAMMRVMKNLSLPNYMLFGAMNGLLPCGMVYVAIAAAMSTNGLLTGTVMMASFGAGTLPAMFALALFGYMVKMPARNQLRRLSPYFVCAIGLVLILRGLNLGIPFVSPAMEGAPQSAIDCR